MGSEMCIRDSPRTDQPGGNGARPGTFDPAVEGAVGIVVDGTAGGCLLYTSDAADERSSGDLGGRRIIKKKHTVQVSTSQHHT